MIYGSICSGIESATQAWHPLGWRPAFFSEIDDAPRAVLAHHYPDIPCHGDFTTIRKGSYETIQLLVAGTPCQDFSVAGLRKGLDGDRGSLTIEFVRLLKRLKPTWFVFENVPGILSSDKGKAFGIFLRALGECGYGFAYRILDAQYYGIPQRRRRVFVVGYLGDWRPAAAVLFERESLCGDLAPSRGAGQNTSCDVRDGAAGTLGAHKTGGWGVTDIDVAGAYIPERARAITGNNHRAGGGARDGDDTFIAHTLRGEGFDASEDGTGRGIPMVAGCLQERDSKGADSDTKPGHLIPVAIPILEAGGRSQPIPINTQLGLRGPDTSNTMREGIGIGESGDPMFTLQAAHQHAVAFDCKASGTRGMTTSSHQAPTLRSMTGKKANGGGQVAIAFESRYARNGRGAPSDIASPLKAQSGQTGKGDGAPLVAFDTAQITSKTNRSNPRHGDPCHTLHQSPTHHIASSMAVRRLTPRECERLQGFKDDYTLVPYRGRMMADGPRYRMIGNSMAVPVMQKIGERIEMINKIIGG